MKTILSRSLRVLLHSDYGMIFVLIALCAFFSVATYGEQWTTGAAAGRALAATIKAEAGGSPNVLIVVRNEADDVALAEELRREVEANGGKVLDVVQGEPQDARAAIQSLAAANRTVDVIAGTQETGAWAVFSQLDTDFPALGRPRIITPHNSSWPSFLTLNNLRNIAGQIAVIAILAIGMTMVIITGGIDLSVGSLIALSAVLAAWFIRDVAGGRDATTLGMIAACVVAIALCCLVGAFTGSMITWFNVPPFIITLAMLLVCRGLALFTSKSQSINEIPESFMWLGRGADLFGLPNAVVLMLVLYVLAHVLMSRMRLGRYLYAVGGNREAARLSGVRVERVLMFAYVASAFFAALGGIIEASLHKSGSPNYGAMYELWVIAAVVVGGTSLSGGEGKMFGTLTGAFTIAVIQNGMNLTKVQSEMQLVVLGLVILGAVLIGRLRHS